jgi:predicted TIM-barrel enzyme
VFAGSGVTPDNVATVLDHLDGAIVGTALTRGDTVDPVDEALVAELVAAAEQ